MVKEFHGENDPMSWSEYEMKTGYKWEDVDIRQYKTASKNGTHSCLYRHSKKKTKTVNTLSW